MGLRVVGRDVDLHVDTLAPVRSDRCFLQRMWRRPGCHVSRDRGAAAPARLGKLHIPAPSAAGPLRPTRRTPTPNWPRSYVSPMHPTRVGPAHRRRRPRQRPTGHRPTHRRHRRSPCLGRLLVDTFGVPALTRLGSPPGRSRARRTSASRSLTAPHPVAASASGRWPEPGSAALGRCAQPDADGVPRRGARRARVNRSRRRPPAGSSSGAAAAVPFPGAQPGLVVEQPLADARHTTVSAIRCRPLTNLS